MYCIFLKSPVAIMCAGKPAFNIFEYTYIYIYECTYILCCTCFEKPGLQIFDMVN